MKPKYVVYRECDYDVTNGHSSYDEVKTFRNENDALAFIADPKNLRRYGELYLWFYDEEGKRHEWRRGENKWLD